MIPSITIRDCSQYAYQKTAVYLANVFIKKYGDDPNTDDVIYDVEKTIYHVKKTKAGNVVVRKTGL